MARSLTRVFAAVLAVSVLAAPVLAHHSLSAEFDVNAPIEFDARVVKVDWLNPHIYTHVEVTAGEFAGQTFKIEGGPPNSLYRNGWRKDSLEAGMDVHIEGIRAKSATSNNIGDATITLDDGTEVFSRFGRVR